MRVLILNGSPRRKGNTAQMIQAFCQFAEGLEKVVVPIKGYLECFEGMEFVKMISFWNTAKEPDITKTEVYAEAKIGEVI